MPIPNDTILVAAFVMGMQAITLKDNELVLTCINLMRSRAVELGYRVGVA